MNLTVGEMENIRISLWGFFKKKTTIAEQAKLTIIFVFLNGFYY